MPLSRSQIERLGNRLRDGTLRRDDDDLLADFFAEHERFARESYETVRKLVASASRDLLDTAVTAREIKSLPSIGDKLRRQSTTLAQIQDIVGCRIVISNRLAQDRLVAAICKTIGDIRIVDHRESPANGYRAMHVIVRCNNLRYEIQVRTHLEHQWTTTVESLIPTYGVAVKYGGGPTDLNHILLTLSDLFDAYEREQALRDHMSPLIEDPESIPLGKERESIVRCIDELSQFMENSRACSS